MKSIKFIILLIVFQFLLGCYEKEMSIEKSKESETYACADTIRLKDIYNTLSDVIKIENIDSVRMSNINGSFLLSQPQLKKFRKEISTMEFENNISVKAGNINIEIYIENRSYFLTGSTNGELVRFSNKYFDYYFKRNGINFNNYKPK
ncbi:MAG: hypothetical protein CVV25_07890 [Ignavibacteriae bacterium HGW-Ignavibacteriae-4]|nr:MAG: hypothetical protein CVV25_07890 [Ignavibacteriae bacterium HGW-Ignavibacteriae-4]